MHFIIQTHLDLGGYFSSERYLSTRLIIEPIKQVLQQASSQPFYVFLVPQHQILIILTVDFHGVDPSAGQYLQLPHDRRNVLLTLVGKQKVGWRHHEQSFNQENVRWSRKLYLFCFFAYRHLKLNFELLWISLDYFQVYGLCLKLSSSCAAAVSCFQWKPLNLKFTKYFVMIIQIILVNKKKEGQL